MGWSMAGSCGHQAIVTGGKHPGDLPQFRWTNTLLGNLKTSFNGTFHAFNFDKVARRYLGGYCFRFNRRFSMVAMIERIANAVCCCLPCTERDLRIVEAYGSSSPPMISASHRRLSGYCFAESRRALQRTLQAVPDQPFHSQPSEQPPVTPLTALRVDEQGRLTYMGQDGRRYVILGNGELLHRLKDLNQSPDQD